MNGSTKACIFIPSDLFNAVASESRKTKVSRSAIWTEAMKAYLNAETRPPRVVLEMRNMERWVLEMDGQNQSLFLSLTRLLLRFFRGNGRGGGSRTYYDTPPRQNDPTGESQSQ